MGYIINITKINAILDVILDEYTAPVFIDAHTHIESSFLIPLERGKIVIYLAPSYPKLLIFFAKSNNKKAN